MEPKPIKPTRRTGKKGELAAWIKQGRPAQVGEAEWAELLRLLAPVSENYLRRLLREIARESGLRLAPLIEGVRQESLDALEASLLHLLTEYEKGDAPRRQRVRKLVIEAKDHARLAARKPEWREVETRDGFVDADVARKSSGVSGLGAAAAAADRRRWNVPVRPVKLLDREGLLSYAGRLLATRGLSMGELRDRLKRRAARKEDADGVIAELRGAGYLDDRKLADSIANWRRDNQSVGKMRVVKELMTRRIAPAVAKKAVDTAYSGVEEIDLIDRFLERKYRGKNLGELLRDEKKLASAFRRLRMAGFSAGNSIRILKRYAAAAENLEDSPEEDLSSSPD